MADYYNSSLKIDFTQTRDNHITQYYYFFLPLQWVIIVKHTSVELGCN